MRRADYGDWVNVEDYKKICEVLTVALEKLKKIYALDTSQLSSPTECAAVVLALDAIEAAENSLKTQ